MERTRWLAIPILAALTLLVSALPSRADPATVYQNTITMHLSPSLNQFTSFDIAFVDTNSHTLAQTDRNNQSVDVYDTNEDRFVLASDPVFVGLQPSACNCSGPNGVYIVPGGGRGQGWAGDGNSTVKVINLNNGSEVGSAIPTGGTARADELWWSREDQEIMIGNPDDSTPFESFISTSGTPGPSSLKARLVYDGANTGCAPGTVGSVSITICHTPTGDAAVNGLEQPVFTQGHSDRDNDRDDEHGRFWLSVPGLASTMTGGPTAGHIDEINPDTYKVVNSIPMPSCLGGVTGLTIVNDHELAAACPQGVTYANLSTLSQDGSPIAESGGADQIWYNPGDGNVYSPNSTAEPAGCAATGLTLVTTNRTPPNANVGGFTGTCVAVVHGNSGGSASVTAEVQLPIGAGSHNVSADSQNNEAFVPVKDLDCTAGTCPPTASTNVCPSLEQGGCLHDQGEAVIQLGP